MHQQFVAGIDKTDGDFALLVHVPHADELVTFKASVPHFLMAAEAYMYHGSGFGYNCASGGWISTDAAVTQAYSAPLGSLGLGSSLTMCGLIPSSVPPTTPTPPSHTHSNTPCDVVYVGAPCLVRC